MNHLNIYIWSSEFTNVLSSSEFNDSDLSLLSWLQSIPPDTFSCPFEQEHQKKISKSFFFYRGFKI